VGAMSRGEYEAGLDAAGFEDVSITFTHEITDGVHGAIVKARTPTDPAARGLPVVQPATSTGGCC
jgi:arsenite methyltransferase